LPGSEVVGMDINEQELLQGARVFSDIGNICFAYGDIETALPASCSFDYIILSASIQYFRSPTRLFSKLLSLLAGNGEIHVIDSPIYSPKNGASARMRSQRYFNDVGFPLMEEHYYHHTWDELAAFHPKILYDSDSLYKKIKRKFLPGSPFPWIKITGSR